MSKDPYRDQAAKLKQKIERVQDDVTPKKREPLPPRGELHREKKKKNKWKIKYPMISMLLLFFILLPLTVFSIYSYFDSRTGPLLALTGENKGLEEVQYDESNDQEENELSSSEESDSSPTTTVEKEEDVTTPSNGTEKKQEDLKQPDKGSSSTNQGKDGGEQPKDDAQPEPEEKQTQNIVYHKVQPQETLFRIAMKYYHSQAGIEKIRQRNNIQDNEIQTGQVLEIPLD
ncbi:LysM peptidoglycan-binding domain-containing protein [Rossellomorea aquimaris]|uniref:LysM peptidoglycan-binding domain-containing protein n=1 Tax=Rossellomorea aquimaris TaxID=189382 RepID=UPI0007D08345|nr:LysM peptidoglycan-binding domain-containing protein [Rossellomorea aquimaris]